MAIFVLIGVLRGFPAAAYRRTPHRKPLYGLDQNKNCSFLNWAPIVFVLDLWMDTNSGRVRNIQLRVFIKSELTVLVLCQHGHYSCRKTKKYD